LSEYFCNSLKNIIKKDLNEESFINKNGKIHILNMASNRGVKKFMEKIYSNSNPILYLKRKREKYLDFLNKKIIEKSNGRQYAY